MLSQAILMRGRDYGDLVQSLHLRYLKRPRRPLCDLQWRNGGQKLLLDRPLLTVGRTAESDVLIHDASISSQHAQFLRQASGDYVQDLTSLNGTQVNGEPLLAPRLLQKGDIISLGNIRLEYTFIPEARTTPLPPLPTPSPARQISGPVPLRLPSKPK